MPSKPREKTEEEVREEFLNTIHALVDFWSKVEGKTDKEKCDGVAFSILNIFDGCSIDFPALDICIVSPKEDMKYYKENGYNWYKHGMVINNCFLHELWHKKGKNNGW